jgi:hypothetical protein
MCPRGTAILRRLIDVMYWLLPLTLRFLRGFPLDQWCCEP